jgi:DNA-binding response OmpR family regulator
MKTTTSTKTSSAPAHSAQASGQPAPARKPAARRVLLVDDDPTVRDSLNDVLVSEGYFVIPAENGQQALELAGRLPVDLALLDLNMPVKNGWDTFEHLTREHPLLPIIIVTARPNQLFTALNAGVGALLEKPMDIPILLRTMEKLLAESAEMRLARLVGKGSALHYKPSETSHKLRVTAKSR